LSVCGASRCPKVDIQPINGCVFCQVYQSQQRVLGSKPRKVNGGDRKGIRPSFTPELQQSVPVNQRANSPIPYREYRDFKQDKKS